MSAPLGRSCPRSEQAVGWALHALEPDEEMALLLHVPQCRLCQAAIHGTEDALSYLGASVEQVEPPESLRGAILTSVSQTPQRPPFLRPRSSPESVPESVLPRTQAPAPQHRSDAGRGLVPPGLRDVEPGLPRGSRHSRRRLVAASLALVGVLIVGGLTVRTSQLEQQRDAETAQAQGIVDLVNQLDRPGVTHAVLASGDNGSTVAAVLVADGRRQVYTVGLRANPTDRTTYVLWGTRAGAGPTALGTFDVAAADRGLRTVGSAGEADGFTGYAISLEPGRTPPAVPSTVVARGQVEI